MPRTVVKVANDEYLEWSSIVDAPVSPVMSREEALAFYGAERVARVDERGHSAMWCEPQPGAEFIRFNRAGPGEANLTPDAIRRRYAPGVIDSRGEPLRPDEVQVGVTAYVNHPDIPPEKLFWSPWRPGDAPDRVTEETDLHATVEMTDDETARWRAMTWEQRHAWLAQG